jgi:hypothetical protein
VQVQPRVIRAQRWDRVASVVRQDDVWAEQARAPPWGRAPCGRGLQSNVQRDAHQSVRDEPVAPMAAAVRVERALKVKRAQRRVYAWARQSIRAKRRFRVGAVHHDRAAVFVVAVTDVKQGHPLAPRRGCALRGRGTVLIVLRHVCRIVPVEHVVAMVAVDRVVDVLRDKHAPAQEHAWGAQPIRVRAQARAGRVRRGRIAASVNQRAVV